MTIIAIEKLVKFKPSNQELSSAKKALVTSRHGAKKQCLA